MRLVVSSLGLALLLTGCPSRSLMQRADTLEPGDSRLGVALTGGVAHDPTNTIPQASLDVEYRLGVTEGFDLGLRAWPIGGRLSGKLRLYDQDGLSMAAHLALGGSALQVPGDDGEASPLLYRLDATVELLVGFDLGEHQVVAALHVAPGYGGLQADSEDGIEQVSLSGYVIESGLLLGIDLRLSSSFHLMPEVGVFSRAGEQRDVASVLNTDPIVVHGGVGGYFHF